MTARRLDVRRGRAPGRAHRGALAMAWLSACTSSVVEPALEPGEVLLVAALDADGRVLEARAWSGATDRVDVPEGGALAGFAFPADALVDEDGVVLPLDAISVRLSSAVPSGGCGRCFGRAGAAPQVLRGGESCPPPLFSRPIALWGEASDARLLAAREELRLDAPGDCACRSAAEPPTPEAVDFTLRPVSPGAGFWPVERLALTSSGAVGLFGEHLARIVGA